MTATRTMPRTTASTTAIITAIMTIFQFHDVGGDVVVVAICSSLAGHKLSTVMDKFYMHDKHI